MRIKKTKTNREEQEAMVKGKACPRCGYLTCSTPKQCKRKKEKGGKTGLLNFSE